MAVFFSLNVASRSAMFFSLAHKRHHPSVRQIFSRHNGRPNDYIDVEVDDSGSEKKSNQQALSKETREKKGFLGDVVSGVGGFLASKIPALKLIKSEDKESIQKREV